MWLVLCSSDDESAIWSYQGLKERGLAPVELVRAEILPYARWEHRLGVDGFYLDITLPDGRRICSENVKGVLNRLLFAPFDTLLLIHSSDRDYVIHELTTFFMSWLNCLPQPMLNTPMFQSLSGQWRHVSEWVWLASQAGLPIPVYRQSSRDNSVEVNVKGSLVTCHTPVKTSIVVDRYVVGASAPPDIQKGCRRLAELSDTALLGVDFVIDVSGTWTFAGATVFPDLRLGGDALLDVLTTVLKGEKEAST